MNADYGMATVNRRSKHRLKNVGFVASVLRKCTMWAMQFIIFDAEFSLYKHIILSFCHFEYNSGGDSVDSFGSFTPYYPYFLSSCPNTSGINTKVDKMFFSYFMNVFSFFLT